MKFLIASLLLASTSTFSAIITSAKIDATNENILVDVKYSGGCAEHTFKLSLGDEACLELDSKAVDCIAMLFEDVQGGADVCAAIVRKTVVINLKEEGLYGSYWSGAKLTITTHDNARTATVVIP